MAGMAAINAIGLISGGLGIISFFQDNMAAPEAEGPTVNIKAGLPEVGDQGEKDSLGGQISHVYSWDERGEFSATADGCHIDSGGICKVTVDQEVPGRRAGWIGLANDDDATCIAWITVSQFDTTSGGAWTGDIGKECGMDWHYSAEPAGRMPDDESKEYIPNCAWIDGDHTNDIKNGAMKFDVSAYGEHVEDTLASDACGATKMGADSGPINKRKRSNTNRPDKLANQLIVSKWSSQPAADLCNSATSWGPDFVGSDHMFCDMETKTLSPLCSFQDVDGCIDVAPQSNGTATGAKLTRRMHVARRAADVVHKEYNHIQNWGQ